MCPQNLVRWCDSSPCKNGGQCWQTSTLYRCECHSGWTGLYCDVPSVSCKVAAQQRGQSWPQVGGGPGRVGAEPGPWVSPSSSLCRHRCRLPVPAWRTLRGRRQHPPLPLPGWLHGQLLRGGGGRVFTQPLPEWGHLYRLPGWLLLQGEECPGTVGMLNSISIVSGGWA